MRILTAYLPVPGFDPSIQIRLISRWATEWSRIGHKPFCATEPHLSSFSPFKWLVEAFKAPQWPNPERAVARNAGLVAASLLKDGELALISHYDLLPGPDVPFGYPGPDAPENLRLWDSGALALGTKEQFLRLLFVPIDPVLLEPSDPLEAGLTHYNTLELRATLFPQTVQWHADKVEPPAQPQFGRQFAPRNKR